MLVCTLPEPYLGYIYVCVGIFGYKNEITLLCDLVFKMLTMGCRGPSPGQVASGWLDLPLRLGSGVSLW